MTKDEAAAFAALKLALEALEDENRLTKMKTARDILRKALAQPTEPRNFCPRCGKRTADLTVIHTCTPPEGGHQ